MEQIQKRPRTFIFRRLIRWGILAAINIGLTLLIYWKFGWQGSLGISNALFLVGMVEFFIAAGVLHGSAAEGTGSFEMRVLTGIRDKPGSLEHQQEIWADIFQKEKVAGHALICGLIAVLLAILVSFL